MPALLTQRIEDSSACFRYCSVVHPSGFSLILWVSCKKHVNKVVLSLMRYSPIWHCIGAELLGAAKCCSQPSGMSKGLNFDISSRLSIGVRYIIWVWLPYLLLLPLSGCRLSTLRLSPLFWLDVTDRAEPCDLTSTSLGCRFTLCSPSDLPEGLAGPLSEPTWLGEGDRDSLAGPTADKDCNKYEYIHVCGSIGTGIYLYAYT